MKKEASAEAKERLNTYNAEQPDWEGKCRKCGVSLKGSLKDLKEHTCGQ